MFARVLAAFTAVLVFVGALVTTTGSGLSVPDWPLSFGKINPRMVGGVAFEHGHRLVAAFVGFLTLTFAFWASLAKAPRTVRRVGWLALALVVFQGLLGGLTVLMRLPTVVSVAHGTTAQLFFCTVVALVLLTSETFNKAPVAFSGSRARSMKTASLAAFSIVLLQLVIGATMRHLGAGLVIPDFPTSLGRWIPPLVNLEVAVNFTHRVMALMVFLVCCALIYRVHRSGQRVLQNLGLILGLLVAVQVTLGALTVWTGRGLFPTSFHVVNGALVLATCFAIVMWCFRLSVSVAKSDPVRAGDRGTRKDWVELAKFRLVTLSAFTAGVGYWVSLPQPDWWALFMVVAGVFVLGSGSGILNHVLEVDTDSRMDRTKNRPLPAGRVNPLLAERVGASLTIGGIFMLGFTVGPLSGVLAFLAAGSYLFVYTPLKRTTPLCTVVGAVPGALPVLIGWTAGTGRLDLGGWILFAILFLWQLPHFMAIAWLCREDYQRAGLPMVTVVDPKGNLAATQILAYCLALLPVSMAPTLTGMAGPFYFFAALILGLCYLGFGLRMSFRRDRARARQLLLVSVMYLPLLYGCLMLGR